MKLRKFGLIVLATTLCLSSTAQTGYAAGTKTTVKKETTEKTEATAQKEPTKATTAKKDTTTKKDSKKETTAKKPAQKVPNKIKPVSIKLDRTSCITVVGAKFWLRAAIFPQSAAKSKILWKSSNEKVAKVGAKGIVSVVGTGAAYIMASTENGKRALCRIDSRQYIRSSHRLIIGTSEGGVRSYKIYYQGQYRTSSGQPYYSSYGCVTTAVAIIASSCKDKDGKIHEYDPRDIHEGSSRATYSERYAVIKMGRSSELGWYGRTAISLHTASEILKNIGIENKVVYSYNKSEAKKEIREHLKQGKPVIVKVNNSTHNGIRLANFHHALVVVGIDDNDQIIYINPSRAQTYRVSLSTLVDYHMTPAVGNYAAAYMTDTRLRRTAGGYILIE